MKTDDLLDPSDSIMDIEDVRQALITFARYHVKKALREAYKKAKIVDDPDGYLYAGNTGSEYLPDQVIDKNSIIKAYPTKNIK